MSESGKNCVLREVTDAKKIRIAMKNQTREKCTQLLQKTQKNGDLRGAKRILTTLAVSDGTLYSTIATTLKVSEESIRLWVDDFLQKVEISKSNGVNRQLKNPSIIVQE